MIPRRFCSKCGRYLAELTPSIGQHGVWRCADECLPAEAGAPGTGVAPVGPAAVPDPPPSPREGVHHAVGDVDRSHPGASASVDERPCDQCGTLWPKPGRAHLRVWDLGTPMSGVMCVDVRETTEELEQLRERAAAKRFRDPIVDQIVLAACGVVESELSVRGATDAHGRRAREASRSYFIDELMKALLKLEERSVSEPSIVLGEPIKSMAKGAL